MTIEIDVKNLSKADQYKIMQEILMHNDELKNAIEEVVPNMERSITMEYIDKIIAEDFKRYDDVFRRLA
jgi:hypothetical protein